MNSKAKNSINPLDKYTFIKVIEHKFFGNLSKYKKDN